MPPLTKQRRKEPRPSMSVLPVKQPLPSGLALEPITISFPYLTVGTASGGAAISGDASGDAYLRHEPYPPMNTGRTPRWMASDGKFGEIGRWRFRVDRMGIMKDLRVPVAWKEPSPDEVYFWTGREWARVPRNSPSEPFDDILYRARSDIAKIASREGPEWDERDTSALAASASLMRYMWVGDIDLTESSRRAGLKSLSGDVAEGE
jgi:hypothetical protein